VPADVNTYALDRHVPRIVLDWLADTPEQRWRSVPGTMVFADIAGFTALSERLAERGRIGAEELVETLSRVFGAMLTTAAERGGQLLKFGGDALLFLFTSDDHAMQACSASVEMRSQLRRSTEVLTSVGRLSLSISIGVHSDDFDLFLVGGSHRELVLLGPGVSQLVACEKAASGGDIVVSAATARHLPAESVRADGERFLLRWRHARPSTRASTDRRAGDDLLARRLLPKILVSHLDQRRPDPSHRVATIAFMRFSGTDQLLTDEGPERLAERLDRTLGTIQAAFEAEDIAMLCVDCDEDGGKVFCASGVPLSNEDDEGRMLRAASAIIAADLPLSLQIGIQRGHVFAAEVGVPMRAAFSAMGDTTNTAARICAKAPIGGILVHPAVLEHTRMRYAAELAGSFTFKGKSQPQVLYSVGEELGRQDPVIQERFPFVGRVAERAMLRELVDRLRAAPSGSGDGGSSVVLTGVVGVGKSRLVQEVLDEADDIPLVAMRAEPYGLASAYRVIRDPLRSLLNIDRGTPEAMEAALRAAVDTWAPEHHTMLPLLGNVLQIAVPPTAEVDAILSRYRPERTADVVVDLLQRRLAGPVVFVIEDAHWADDSSANLIERLAAETRSRPWLVVVIRRDDPGGVVIEDATQLTIAPLERDAVHQLAVAITDSAPLRPHEIEQIVERSGGNPLFVGELCRAVRQLGSVEAVPVSLQGAIAAQVDALDPFAGRVLAYASVLGRSFRREVLVELLRRERVDVDEATLERLARFIEPDGPDRWRFRNGLVRDITYDGLGYHLRTHLHLEAGETVEQMSADLAADADTLALHFAAAGDHERTLRYATVAATRAELAHANSNAAAHLERALAAARRLAAPEDVAALWARLAEARDHAGLLDASVDAYRQAASLTDDPVARDELVLRRAGVREKAGAFATALRESTAVRNRLGARTDPNARRLSARAAAFAAVIRQRQRRVEEARELARTAAAEAEAWGDRAALARALGVISWAMMVRGDEGASEQAAHALELFVEIDDLVGQAHMANNLGGYAYFAGEWAATLDWYARSEDACERMGNVTDAAVASANTAEVLVNQGRVDEAEARLRAAARVLRSSGHLLGATFAEMHLGRVHVARGDHVTGELLLQGCVDANSAMGSAASAYEAALYLSECLSLAGRPADALDVVERAGSAAGPAGAMFEPNRCFVVAGAHAALGRDDLAAATIADGVLQARQRGVLFELARLLSLAADLGVDAELLGTPNASEEAKSLFDRLGVRQSIAN
jgi:class 3 adenylate cyclase/tetratricopeptide (TPR) repeat protein